MGRIVLRTAAFFTFLLRKMRKRHEYSEIAFCLFDDVSGNPHFTFNIPKLRDNLRLAWPSDFKNADIVVHQRAVQSMRIWSGKIPF